MLEKTSDAQLVVQFIKGTDAEKKEIISVLYERYKRLMLKICYSYLKDYDRAHDLFHESFIKIIEHLDKLANPAVFKSWAMLIVKNTCVDALRKASVLKEGEKVTARITVAYGSRIEERYVAEIDRSTALTHLQTCVKQLAGCELNIFRLRWQGLKAAQIVELLKMDRADVRRSYDRIKKVLETCMARKGFTTSIEEIISLGEFDEQR